MHVVHSVGFRSVLVLGRYNLHPKAVARGTIGVVSHLHFLRIIYETSIFKQSYSLRGEDGYLCVI